MEGKIQKALSVLIERAQLRLMDYLFPSCVCSGHHLSTQQYAKIVNGWVESIGLDKSAYGTDSLRRMKASIIYKQTKNLRAIKTKLSSDLLLSVIAISCEPLPSLGDHFESQRMIRFVRLYAGVIGSVICADENSISSSILV